MEIVGASIIFGFIYGCFAETALPVPVVYPGIFLMPAKVSGSEAELDNFLFDTGSPFTWMYHYKFVQKELGLEKGGYAVTNLKTRVVPPEGGMEIKYVDESIFEASVWTKKTITIGHHTWREPFGIVKNVKNHLSHIPKMTGLIGASRDSEFAKSHPIFGFTPLDQGTMVIHLNQLDPIKVCKDKKFMTLRMPKEGRYARHWSSDVEVKFSRVLYKTGVVLDTGSSVIVLNSQMFTAYLQQLEKLNIRVEYTKGSMSGALDCKYVEKLPSWEIRNGQSSILITPFMYVRRRSRTHCRVLVAGIDGNHPMIIGTPLLRWVVSQFDVADSTMSVCVPVRSFVEDYRKAFTDPGYDEELQCPGCNSKGITDVLPSISMAVAIIVIASHLVSV
jgi:hypothetical protein